MRVSIGCFFAGVVLLLGAGAGAADLQAKTVDGQVIQGEYLGTENNLVRMKTAYGTILIPSKDIVTLTAINLPERPKPADGGNPPGAPATLPPPVDEVKLDALVFHEPKAVSLAPLLAARMPQIPEALKGARVDLFRQIRNFGDSTDAARQRIIGILRGYGLMAYPFIDGAYTLPDDLEDKVELLQAVAGQHRPWGAGLFASTHAEVLNEMKHVAAQSPALPPEVITQRRSTPTRTGRLRMLARDARAIEGYAALSGGPFNTLFLLNIYKERYAGDVDVLLKDATTDQARLGVVAGDLKVKAAEWRVEDRRLLIEMAFPLYFTENEDLKGLAEELLKKLLPDKHPKWTAPQAEWYEWWQQHRDELK